MFNLNIRGAVQSESVSYAAFGQSQESKVILGSGLIRNSTARSMLVVVAE